MSHFDQIFQIQLIFEKRLFFGKRLFFWDLVTYFAHGCGTRNKKLVACGLIVQVPVDPERLAPYLQGRNSEKRIETKIYSFQRTALIVQVPVDPE